MRFKISENYDLKYTLHCLFVNHQFFYRQCSIFQELQDYIASIGFASKDFEIVVNFPRRNLTDIDNSRTLKEEKLFPQETIFVQER